VPRGCSPAEVNYPRSAFARVRTEPARRDPIRHSLWSLLLKEPRAAHALAKPLQLPSDEPCHAPSVLSLEDDEVVGTPGEISTFRSRPQSPRPPQTTTPPRRLSVRVRTRSIPASRQRPRSRSSGQRFQKPRMLGPRKSPTSPPGVRARRPRRGGPRTDVELPRGAHWRVRRTCPGAAPRPARQERAPTRILPETEQARVAVVGGASGANNSCAARLLSLNSKGTAPDVAASDVRAGRGLSARSALD
jgi:hypothetical protein